MKRVIIFSILLLGIIFMPVAALDVPPLKGHVNDYASMLTPVLVQSLERGLTEFENKESTQIVVLTIPSLKGEVLEEYSIKVAQKWKIGQMKLDNGVILLVAKEDRKMRIEVGYGLEGRLTDLVAGRIIDNEIKPWFKKGEYSIGVRNGTSAIMRAVKGEYTGVESDPAITKSLWKTSWFQQMVMIVGVTLFMGLIVLIMFIFARKGYGGGGGGSSYGSDSYSSSSSDSSSSSSSSSNSSDSYSGGGGSFGGGGASGDW